MERRFYSDADMKFAVYQLRVKGTFSAPMGFVNFPVGGRAERVESPCEPVR